MEKSSERKKQPEGAPLAGEEQMPCVAHMSLIQTSLLTGPARKGSKFARKQIIAQKSSLSNPCKSFQSFFTLTIFFGTISLGPIFL